MHGAVSTMATSLLVGVCQATTFWATMSTMNATQTHSAEVLQ